MGVPVDDEGRYASGQTEADHVADDEGDLHPPHYINLFGGTVFVEPLGRYKQRLRKAFASTAEDMMTRDPDTIGPNTSAKEAALLIHETGHNRLPVVEDGVYGVVTRLDVLGALRNERLRRAARRVVDVVLRPVAEIPAGALGRATESARGRTAG